MESLSGCILELAPYTNCVYVCMYKMLGACLLELCSNHSVCECVFLFVVMYVCVYACMYIYVCLYIFVCMKLLNCLLFHSLSVCVCTHVNSLSILLFLDSPKELKEFIVFPLATESASPRKLSFVSSEKILLSSFSNPPITGAFGSSP